MFTHDFFWLATLDTHAIRHVRLSWRGSLFVWPLLHALIGGAAGFVVSIIGAVATWNRGFGPHWYPLALIVLAIPQAWAGGRLRVVHQGRRE